MNFFALKIKHFLLFIFFIIHCKSKDNYFIKDLNPIQQNYASVEGNFIIGALFPIHKKPKSPIREKSLTCGSIQDEYGIQRIEAALWIINRIKRSPHFQLKNNYTFGIEIRDSCWNPRVALRQSLHYINFHLRSSEEICEMKNESVIGVIGPASSEETMQVQNLLQIFDVPQIGYSATSQELNDSNKYPYFARIVPCDRYQAEVIIRILQEYKWNYVFLVYTKGNYGSSGANEFETMAKEKFICIIKKILLPENISKDELNKILRELKQDKKTRIIVCFCQGYDTRKLLKAIKYTNNTEYFLIIGTDGSGGRYDLVKDLEDQAFGSIMIQINSPYVTDFDKYYFDLYKRKDNYNNPWIYEFWKNRFNCSFNTNDSLSKCTGKEDLSVNYSQDPKLAIVIKSIYILVYAMKNLINDMNEEAFEPCFNGVNGTKLMEYIKNLIIPSDEMVDINNIEDTKLRNWYDILNFQIVNGSYQYTKVGYWKSGNFYLNKTKIQLSNSFSKNNLVLACMPSCLPGEKKIYENSCCWKCEKCPPNQIANNKSECVSCNDTQKPNENRTECIPKDMEYVALNLTLKVICYLVPFVGIFLTLFSAAVFLKYDKTPVVIYSSRELCYVMFCGMILLHCSAFFILNLIPTKFTCILVRLLPGVSLTVTYSALLVKTKRIARVFSMSKRRFPKKLKYLSSRFQIFICCVIITVEILICIIQLIIEPPRIEMSSKDTIKIMLRCYEPSYNFLSPYTLNIGLFVFCTLYAFKTRNLPDNFNESKFIGFSCYATFITWVAYLLLYLSSERRLQIVSFCLSLTTNALIILTCLFFPKLYIILWRPEKNKKSFFMTTKGLRCHFGSTDSLHNKEFSIQNDVNINQVKKQNKDNVIQMLCSAPSK